MQRKNTIQRDITIGGVTMQNHWEKADALVDLYLWDNYDVDIFPIGNSIYGNWE